jgi:hypothetical protein
MRLEEAFLSLNRNRQARPTEQHRGKTRVKEAREIENESLLFHESEIELHSGNAETESGGKGVWYSEEPDRDLWSSFRASIAHQALGPGETPMCSLCTRKPSHRRRLCQSGCFSELDIDLLVTKELHHFPPMKAALPVSPEYRMRSWWR